LYPDDGLAGGGCLSIGVPIVVSKVATFVSGGTSYKAGGWTLPKRR
jgi:hypothetical protein